jgi:hypothetical protein
MRTDQGRCRANRSGQAMVEFIIALVGFLVLTAGLLQLAQLARTHTDCSVEARRLAGQHAMSGIGTVSTPDYIRDWSPGPDTERHTADDTFSAGVPSAFLDTIVERAVPEPDDWAVIAQAPRNGLYPLHGSQDPVSRFGLVRGVHEESVTLLPAVQRLLYDARSIDVKSEVWLTWTKGIY